MFDVSEGTEIASVTIMDLAMRRAGTTRPRGGCRSAAKSAVLYVIHDSTLNAIADARQVAMDAIEKMTLGDPLGDAKSRQLIEAIGFVLPDPTRAGHD